MNLAKKILLSFAFTNIFFCTAIDQSFFEKVNEIKKNIYKIPAQDLQIILGRSFDPPPTISADELKSAMQSNPELFVINVLPASLHEDCHIEGSHNAPLRELVFMAQSWQKEREIIVYCALHECDAGEKAYILLSCMGFTNVIDYKGGIKEWFQLDYPTQGLALSTYLHTKAVMMSELLYPEMLVCSRQTRFKPHLQ